MPFFERQHPAVPMNRDWYLAGSSCGPGNKLPGYYHIVPTGRTAKRQRQQKRIVGAGFKPARLKRRTATANDPVNPDREGGGWTIIDV